MKKFTYQMASDFLREYANSSAPITPYSIFGGDHIRYLRTDALHAFMAETLCFFMEHPEYQKDFREHDFGDDVSHNYIRNTINKAKKFAENHQLQDDEWKVTKL